MNTKRLDALISKELKRAGKDYKREKARCKKMYPDWEDNEFNMLDYRFIWAYTPDANLTSSFYTWDDALVYFNRATKKYHMTIDTGFYGLNYDADLARTESDRLSQIDEAFRDFLIEKGLPMRADIFPFEDPALEADTLSELYVKFRIMIEGYKIYNNKRSYYNQDIINIVNEEAALFFDGQKSARDVAAIIQSRVQLYVDENR